MSEAETETVLPGRQGKPWTGEEDRLLYDSFVAGQPMTLIASVHQRGEGGIRSRLRLLGLIDRYGEIIDPAPPFAAQDRKRAVKAAKDAPPPVPHLPRAFSALTPDGWEVEIRSNRVLDQALAERLGWMLRGASSE